MPKYKYILSYKDALSREVCYEDDTIIADSIENAIIAIKKLHLAHKYISKKSVLNLEE